MPHITVLDLASVLRDTNYDPVLKTISTTMIHLQWLEISYSAVEPSALEYLLPRKDNAPGGCPELMVLRIWGIPGVKVMLLKKLILGLPKLRCLAHGLLINALVELTDADMGTDTVRSMAALYGSNTSIKYIHLTAPVFQRLDNITKVVLDRMQYENTQSIVSHVLISLKKLKIIVLIGIRNPSKNVLPALEQMGHRLECLLLHKTSGNLNIHDVVRTCPALQEFALSYKSHDTDSHGNLSENPRQLPVLYNLKTLCLGSLRKDMCSVDTLNALLASPRLEDVYLQDIEAMCDDVILNLLSFDGWSCAPLSRVVRFILHSGVISAVPFVQWLARKECILEKLFFIRCQKLDAKVLSAAAKNYPKALNFKYEENVLFGFLDSY